jgi:hypothetical protein
MSWVVRGYGSNDRIEVEFLMDDLLRSYFIDLLSLSADNPVFDSFPLDEGQLIALKRVFHRLELESRVEYFLEYDA